MGRYISPGGEGTVEGANRITQTGAPGGGGGVHLTQKGRHGCMARRPWPTGGPSSALGSELGNLFTFLNPKFPHL